MFTNKCTLFLVTRLCSNQFLVSLRACLSPRTLIYSAHWSCLSSHSFFWQRSLLIYNFHPSTILLSSLHPVIHPQTFIHPFSQSLISLLQHPLHPPFISVPEFTYIVPCRSSFCSPRHLHSSNSLIAQPFALLNYSGFIICFLFFTRLVSFSFLLFHFMGKKINFPLFTSVSVIFHSSFSIMLLFLSSFSSISP